MNLTSNIHLFVENGGGGDLLPTLYLKSNLSINKNNNIDKDYEVTSSNTSLS